MRIVFCDDDPRIVAQLEGILREFFRAGHLEQPEYSSYTTGEALLEHEKKVDIAFLDVEMPGLSGIHTGARLQKRNPHIKVFIVTSYGDYLDEAMKFHVFRYLTKPLDKARIFRNMKDALFQLGLDAKPVLIETAGEVVTRYADDIVMVESAGKGSRVHTVGAACRSLQPMKHWQKLLEAGSFYQTHRGFIVNMKYVHSFSSGSITLRVPDGGSHTAYLSRRRYTDFKNAYMLYVEAMW